MVRTRTRLVILLMSAVVVAQVFTVWAATGRAGYTRYFDPERAQREQQTDHLADLFENTGLQEGMDKLADVPNRFMLGIAPSGSGKYAVSVVTLVSPVVVMVMIVGAGLLRSRGRHAPSCSRDGAFTQKTDRLP